MEYGNDERDDIKVFFERKKKKEKTNERMNEKKGRKKYSPGKRNEWMEKRKKEKEDVKIRWRVRKRKRVIKKEIKEK